jgi:aldose 1-epimerase
MLSRAYIFSGTVFSGLRPSGRLGAGLIGAGIVSFALSGAISCAPSETQAPAESPDQKELPVKAADDSSEAMQTQAFGSLDGQPVSAYTITNANGLSLTASDYGATITKLIVPDRDGKLGDVVLGFETLEEYQKGSPYFGATVGRVGNRIANAKFELGGRTYELAANNAPHHLHGGQRGWDKVLWTAESKTTENGPAIRFTYTSKDGEEGYPGTVQASVLYVLTDDNQLVVEMEAETDRATPLNMVHHTYWNLGGFGSGTILDHELQLNARKYTPGTPMVPDGRIKDVEGTPFDFTAAKPIGKDIEKAGGDPVGFDHNFVVDGASTELRVAAKLRHPASGRVMTVKANQPGIQFYSGNYLDGKTEGKGVSYPKWGALCLESQTFPNSINVKDWRDSVILEPGEHYRHVMIHEFSVE